MKITEIKIAIPQYGPNKDKYEAAITVAGQSSYQPEIKIGLEPELLDPILGIIQGAVVVQLDRGVMQFKDEIHSRGLPAVEAEALEDYSE